MFFLLSVALFEHQSWSSNIHTVIIEIVPSTHVAMLYGVTGAAGTLVGAVAQLGIGPVVDAGRFGSATAVIRTEHSARCVPLSVAYFLPHRRKTSPGRMIY